MTIDDRMPNLFIVGAMKSATTSLCSYLCQHPDIFMSPEKEPFYFVEGREFFRKKDHPVRPDAKFSPGLMSNGSYVELENYLSLFRHGIGKKYRAEGSPLYLPDPDAAKRIKEKSPNSKIIAVLRNPIERAYSAFTFQQSFNRETVGTFRDAIREELDGKRDDWWYGWRHIYTGMYHEQISRYIEVFGEDNILILKQEDLRKNPKSTLQSIFYFLEIESNIEMKLDHESNVTRIRPAWMRLAYDVFYAKNPLKKILRNIIPIETRKNLNSSVRRKIEKFGSRPPSMPDADRDLLRDVYKESISELERKLKWAPTNWK